MVLHYALLYCKLSYNRTIRITIVFPVDFILTNCCFSVERGCLWIQWSLDCVKFLAQEGILLGLGTLNYQHSAKMLQVGADGYVVINILESFMNHSEMSQMTGHTFSHIKLSVINECTGVYKSFTENWIIWVWKMFEICIV